MEIKWSKRYYDRPNELKRLIKYCNENKLKQALAKTIDKYGMHTESDVDIYYLPAAALTYSIGKSIISPK